MTESKEMSKFVFDTISSKQIHSLRRYFEITTISFSQNTMVELCTQLSTGYSRQIKHILECYHKIAAERVAQRRERECEGAKLMKSSYMLFAFYLRS